METSKADWKLFREKIGGWQESYMERLNREYVDILSEDKAASEKFWELDERIRADQRSPGVMLELRKANMFWDLLTLIKDGAINAEDLTDFSPELQSEINTFLREHK